MIDNSRYGENTFKVSQASVLHGFAGYFTAHLFRDIKISIEPENATPEMFSWFPIFFPLKVYLIHWQYYILLITFFWKAIFNQFCCLFYRIQFTWQQGMKWWLIFGGIAVRRTSGTSGAFLSQFKCLYTIQMDDHRRLDFESLPNKRLMNSFSFWVNYCMEHSFIFIIFLYHWSF